MKRAYYTLEEDGKVINRLEMLVLTNNRAVCGCTFTNIDGQSQIGLCPLHSAARDLRSVLENLLNALGTDSQEDAAYQAAQALESSADEK